MRYVVARDRLLSGDLTNFRHRSLVLVIVLVLHSNNVSRALHACLYTKNTGAAQYNGCG